MKTSFIVTGNEWTDEAKIIWALVNRLGGKRITLTAEELMPQKTDGLAMFSGNEGELNLWTK